MAEEYQLPCRWRKPTWPPRLRKDSRANYSKVPSFSTPPPHPLNQPMQSADLLRREAEEEGMHMGQMIEFYVPASFQPKWLRPVEPGEKLEDEDQRGKVIEFPASGTQKSA